MTHILNQEVGRLRERILVLGSEVEENLLIAVDALKRRDQARSLALIQADEWINEKRIKIGMDCLTLMATQQPVARDMRQIAAIIEIAGELERIHDYVKGISKINRLISPEIDIKALLLPLPDMTAITAAMLHASLTAFAHADEALARRTPVRDSEVDRMYEELNAEVIRRVHETPSDMELANRLQWAGHNIERAADRVINICEWVIYMITGIFEEMDNASPQHEQEANLNY